MNRSFAIDALTYSRTDELVKEILYKWMEEIEIKNAKLILEDGYLIKKTYNGYYDRASIYWSTLKGRLYLGQGYFTMCTSPYRCEFYGVLLTTSGGWKCRRCIGWSYGLKEYYDDNSIELDK